MVSDAVVVERLTKRYRDVTALNEVSLCFEANRVHGLFGKNGAGKTTLMALVTTQAFPTGGSVQVLGANPFKDDRVLPRMCFVRESQKYPDEFTGRDALAVAGQCFARWDKGLAGRLAVDFDLPLKRRIKKMSRGQTSAVGVIIGLASRAEVTFFDEPYLGLDATARQIFYESLLADISERPRTIILSSHLIGEISNIIENVVVLDHGQVILDEEAEALASRAWTLVGPTAAVDSATTGLPLLARQTMGALTSATVEAGLSDKERHSLEAQGIGVTGVALQDLVIHLTRGAGEESSPAVTRSTNEEKERAL
jgi:ABC-2 type transport system ATP-binding protein